MKSQCGSDSIGGLNLPLVALKMVGDHEPWHVSDLDKLEKASKWTWNSLEPPKRIIALLAP